MNDKKIGVDYGIILGEQVLINVENLFIVACIDIFGQTDLKNVLEFADYTFDEHFGKPIGSYPPREVFTIIYVGRAS